jgi:diadenylate cyclase
LFSYFFDYLILIVIVLFSGRFAESLNSCGQESIFFQELQKKKSKKWWMRYSKAASRLAKERIGALIVLERETGLKNFIDTGSRLDSKVNAELLYAIFTPVSPIHDGAVIITEGKLAAAGCFLPLSKDPNIDKRYGTRHRAALGITEDSDAIVVLVSEEAGEAQPSEK